MERFERVAIDCSEKTRGCTTPTRRLRLTLAGEPAGGTGWSSYREGDGAIRYLCPACTIIQRSAS